jgi:hypothetical protein
MEVKQEKRRNIESSEGDGEDENSVLGYFNALGSIVDVCCN